MTLIETMRDFVRGYPPLAGGRPNIDFLPPEAASYSVDAEPIKSEVKRYLDGSSVRQFAFVLATRTYYGETVRQQIDNLAFFEGFEAWLARQPLPDLGEGRTARKLEVTTSGYAFAQETDTARYQIQLKLTYFQKGE